jgi:HPt (histidine-containing phosphotransfer) domain-containing protein
MSDQQFTAVEIDAAPLIDDLQWQRLRTELGDDMLKEFIQEFFDETHETWFSPAEDPFVLDDGVFRSLSHRTAGAAGTLGFKKLRVVMLCMEHSGSRDLSKDYFETLKLVLSDTQSWVADNL